MTRPAAVATCAVLLAGCGGGLGTDSSGSAGSADSTDEVTVFAAASLTEAFTQIGEEFETAHPDIDVRFNFAGSSTLAQQIGRGAPADVFASANTDQMQVVSGQTAQKPAVFAQNRLQIVVPKHNPADIKTLGDFAEPELATAICAEEVPCGEAARTAFDAAGVDAEPDTFERDVKAVLTKVSLGEVDAGLVYKTDVAAAGGKLEGIDFPAADRAVNDYPIAVLDRAPNPEGAEAFAEFVDSPKGQQVLRNHGFVTDTS